MAGTNVCKATANCEHMRTLCNPRRHCILGKLGGRFWRERRFSVFVHNRFDTGRANLNDGPPKMSLIKLFPFSNNSIRVGQFLIANIKSHYLSILKWQSTFPSANPRFTPCLPHHSRKCCSRTNCTFENKLGRQGTNLVYLYTQYISDC